MELGAVDMYDIVVVLSLLNMMTGLLKNVEVVWLLMLSFTDETLMSII